MQDEQQCHPSVPHTGKHPTVAGKRWKKIGTSSLENWGWYRWTGSICIAPPTLWQSLQMKPCAGKAPQIVQRARTSSEDDPKLLAKPSTSTVKSSSPPVLFSSQSPAVPSSSSWACSPEDNTPPTPTPLLQAFCFDPLGQILAPCRSLFSCASTSDSL